jgi:thiamine pyrophosphate-dependent acetolactate synthase large subunit-like protein
MGDGGFGMAMTEIGTAVQAGLNTVTVVMNNGAWGAEKAYQRDFYGGRYVGAQVVSPAFDDIARAFGANGVRAETAEEITAAVAKGFAANVPTIIEVPVDPDSIAGIRKDAFAYRAGAK